MNMNVAPQMFSPDLRDDESTYSECSCDFALTADSIEDCERAFISKLCMPVMDAVGLSAFGVSVGHIVGMGTKEQVFDIDAKVNVASMADLHASRHETIGGFPCEAMSKHQATLPIQGAVSSFSELNACPEHAPRRIWTAVMRKTLYQRPMTRNMELNSFDLSHLPAPQKRRVVRARPAFAAPFGPAFLAQSTVEMKGPLP